MSAAPSIQHKPPHTGEAGFAFDDRGQRVPVTDFDFADVDRDAAIEDLRAALEYQKSKLPELLDLICEFLTSEKLTAEQVQRRVFFFAWLARRTPFASQRELAEHLGITPPAVNQAIADLCQKYPLMMRLRAWREQSQQAA